MKYRKKSLLTGLAAGAMLFAGACGLQDWQRDLLSLGGGLIGGLVGGSTQVTVQRDCFQNGQPVDCSQVPNLQ
ncbi:MAG: hypothetical protein U1D55_10255 [Phycisphaerae bacterium]